MYLLAEFPHGIIIRIYDDAKCSGIKSTKRSREEGRLPQNCAGFKWSTFISIAGNSRAPQSVKISIFQIYGTYFNVSVEQCAKLRGSNQCLAFTESLWVLLGCSRCPDVLQQTIRMFLFLSKPTELYQEYHLCSQISRVNFIVLSRR